MKRKVLSAPVRWAGSKKKLLNEMISLFDDNKKIYVEPFLGSGVVLLNVLQFNIYEEYYVNDSNENLINFFRVTKNNIEELCCEIEKISNKFNKLETIEEKSAFYYMKRKQFNEKRIKLLTRCGIFWFLMKTGYNGVYRVNSGGIFNVPFGKKERINFNKKELIEISTSIENVHFYCLDYSDFLDGISERCEREDCFIYCDPPYIPETLSTKNQVLYTKNRFYHTDFIEYLRNSLLYDSSSIMVSMSKTDTANKIYNECFQNCLKISDIIRTINPEKKICSTEEAYLNYLSPVE